jgi:hypothetical protein
LLVPFSFVSPFFKVIFEIHNYTSSQLQEAVHISPSLQLSELAREKLEYQLPAIFPDQDSLSQPTNLDPTFPHAILTVIITN